MQVLVRDNNVDQALKALKKKMQREGIFREMKLRGHYEKPSERKAREKAEAVRRARKLARKKLQREGLLPMKPKPTINGARGSRQVWTAAPAALWLRHNGNCAYGAGGCPRLCFGGTIALFDADLPSAQRALRCHERQNAWTKDWRKQAARLAACRADRGACSVAARVIGAGRLCVIQRLGVFGTRRHRTDAFAIQPGVALGRRRQASRRSAGV